MKVAFVANTCWNIYNFRRGLVHDFLSNGDEVIVLAPEDDYFVKLSGWGVRVIITPLEGTGANPIKDLIYLKKLLSVFKTEKPDVVLSFTIKANIYSSIAGKLASVPTVCNVSGLGTVFLVTGVAGRIAMLLYKVAFRFSSFIFFQNDEDKALFTSHIQINDSKTDTLPGSGIDLEKFRPLKFRDDNITRFVMISRVIIEKGVREYAQAASNFVSNENVSFTLIGKFDEKHARSIEKSELDHWINSGWIQYFAHSDNIPDVVSKHDAVVLPSYREGTSRTLLEGAAMGRPLIASNVPGCREVVKDGYNGFLCEVKNAQSLTDKLNLFLSLNRSEREQLASNSRMLVEETYDERIVIDMYNAVIRRITH